jgi:NADH dehydrogenase (ubiquinone) 1 alpha subcomplex subunit 2
MKCSNFLLKSYPVMKKHNPHVPVLIREAFGVPAKAYARYGIHPFLNWIDVDFGLEHKVSLDGMSEKECEDAVEKLIKLETGGKQDVL